MSDGARAQSMPVDDESAAVLIVDMDGTLLRTDVLFESVAVLLKRPWSLLAVMVALLRGRPAMKAAMAQRVDLDVNQLPVNAELIDWLGRQRAAGRRLALYSASNEELVARVADRFGIFEFAQGSDGHTNLAGHRKSEAIEARYGTQFSYAGDSRRDLPIWRRCGRAVLVGDVDRLRRSLAETVTVEEAFPHARASIALWTKSLRIHQWAKNALVFVPLLLSGHATGGAIASTILAFVTFGLVASATYMINDLMDLAADRAHPSKRNRPFASGALSIRDGLLALPLLTVAAGVLLSQLPPQFSLVIGVYVLCTVAYSMRLKQAPVLDLIVLAFLFALRLFGGMIAIEAARFSPWLLSFSMFFFFSVASIKRYDEVRMMAARATLELPGRGYRSSDASFLMCIGLTAGLCSTLVFFIYLTDPASPAYSFAHPELMWVICVVLAYWLGRAWLLASRGAMDSDPVLFALRDRVSLALGALTVVISVVARW